MSLTRLTLLSMAVAAIACTPSSDTPSDSAGATTAVTTPQPETLDAAATSLIPGALTIRGLSPIAAGMTIEEASTAAGTTLTSRDEIPGSTCQYLRWTNGPDGVLLMAIDGRIARVEVVEPTIPTAEGIRVGETADRVKQVYAGRVVESPHKYTNGTYLTVTSSSAADSSYRLVFETDGGKVTRFRSGLVPAVEMVEGCS